MSARLRNPAIVLNSEAAGIGVIHALSDTGVDMIAVERNWPPLLGRFSRFPKLRVCYRPHRGESLTETLLQLADRFDGTGVLFPSTDNDLEALIADRERLSARFHVPAAAPIGMQIFDKNWQYEMAERAGVPTPRHVRFRAGAAVDFAALRFPLILKPSSRAVVSGKAAFRLRVLSAAAEVSAALEEIARDYPARPFQLAEDIPGAPDQLYSIGTYSDRSGKVVRWYSGRKVSQYPYAHGTVSIAETISVPPELVRLVEALLNGIGFHGISEVELKFDARDRQFKLIEINGRSWLFIKLATSSGVNLPLIQYYDVTDDPRLQTELKPGQDDRYFFVYEPHVELNRNVADQERIAQLRRSKIMVPAIYHRSERRLNLAYRIRSLVKRYAVQLATP